MNDERFYQRMNALIGQLEKFFSEKKVWFDSIDYEEDGTVVVTIHWGEWKHDHMRCDCYAVDFFGANLIHRWNETTESDGSDCYSAKHYYALAQ